MCCSQNTCKRPRWGSNLSSLAPQPWSWPFTTGFTTTASWHSHRMRFSFKSTFLLSFQCVSFILPTTLKKASRRHTVSVFHTHYNGSSKNTAYKLLPESQAPNSLLSNQTLSSEACWNSLARANTLTSADCSSRPGFLTLRRDTLSESQLHKKYLWGLQLSTSPKF